METDPASGANYWHYNRRNKMRARGMRNDPTKAERQLWELVRKKRIYGFAFTRQRPALNYVADFMCKDLLLILEADGAVHNAEKQKIRDAERTKVLESKGFTILRFKNEDILYNPEYVQERIREWIRERTGMVE